MAIITVPAGEVALAGAGQSNLAAQLRFSPIAPMAGAGNLFFPLRQIFSPIAPMAGAGSVLFPLSQIQRSAFAGTGFAGAGTIVPQMGRIQQASLQSRFAGAGIIVPQMGRIQQGSLVANLAGAGTFANTWLWYPRSFIGATLSGTVGGAIIEIREYRLLALFASFAGAGNLSIPSLVWQSGDPLNPGILMTAGEDVLYRHASGLEKAMADIDAYRLTQTYAELVRDQWDPWAINSRNLGYLAWAMGVNLWEDDWPTEFKRWWVANQWTFKYYRGSDLGMQMAVDAITCQILHLIRPPAIFYPGQQLTDAERKAYVARFPQLRLYPYAPRPQLPWLNYVHGDTQKLGREFRARNGYYLGPLQMFFPTNYNAGGQYLRSCTIYEPRTGIETPCTVRRVYGVLAGHQTPIYYDEITLPALRDIHFYPGTGNKQYFLVKNYPLAKTRRHAIVLGIIDSTPSRIVRVPRDGSLDITQFQAIFQTIVPDLKPLTVRPEMVSVEHPMHKYQFYANQPLGPWKYLVKSDAWMYMYERWYLFDPTRVPDYRRANVYMGRSRFGIKKYSAIAKIAAYWHWPSRYSYYGGFMGPGRFMAPQNTKQIDKVRRAVTASMALRDTVAINTRAKRRIQLKDVTMLDGRFKIGQWITDTY